MQLEMGTASVPNYTRVSFKGVQISDRWWPPALYPSKNKRYEKASDQEAKLFRK